MTRPEMDLKDRADGMDMDFEEQVMDRLDGDAGGCMGMAVAMAELRNEEQ